MKKKRLSAVAAALVLSVFLTACSGYEPAYDIGNAMTSGESILKPVAIEDNPNFISNDYTGVPAVKESAEAVFRSSDGLCVIERKPSYYDVTLDYTGGDYYKAGAAYAEAIMLAEPDYMKFIEPYIYENITMAFPGVNDYEGVKLRCDEIFNSLDEKYRQELCGMSDTLGEGEGFSKDGIISRDEMILAQLIPDVLRGTSCSSISINGKNTASGQRISCRILEWPLGTENQMCDIHAVLHAVNGDKSYTSVSMLGFLTVLTAVNDNGVMIGEFDVGGGSVYEFEGRKSYTYGLRYALENFDTARAAADYLAGNASDYTFSANILITDENDALCVEQCVLEECGRTIIRDSSTPLHKGLEWDDPNCLCIVNSFAVDGNMDQMTAERVNIDRWIKYNRLFSGEKGLTLDRFKELMTCEKTGTELINIRSTDVVHMVIADYETKSIQAVLTGTEGVIDTPVFVDLGCWE